MATQNQKMFQVTNKLEYILGVCKKTPSCAQCERKRAWHDD